MEQNLELLSKISENLGGIPPRSPFSDYNIFNILEITSKEVIICLFLADLLNPEGQHGCGILFLKSFVQQILKIYSMSDLLLSRTDVTKEFVIDNERRIDIVIQNSRFFIPIEVKIYAGEQEGQCYDYFQYVRNARLVYLTRFGDAPSEYSRKQKGGTDLLPLENIQCVSWACDICRWLEKLTMQLHEPLKSMINQYIDAIRAVTDQREQKLMEKNLKLLYESPDSFRAGIEIEKSMKTAKVTLMRLMFDDFKEAMEPIALKYGLELERTFNYYTYEEQCNEKFYDGNPSTCPGLNYIVKNAKFSPESIQMWFRIEVEYNLFAGIALFDTSAEGDIDVSEGCEVFQITEQMLEQAANYINQDIFTPVNWWITWCYPNGKRRDGYYEDVPDFKHMNSSAIRLVDPRNRKNFVKNSVENFEKHILRHLINTQ